MSLISIQQNLDISVYLDSIETVDKLNAINLALAHLNKWTKLVSLKLNILNRNDLLVLARL